MNRNVQRSSIDDESGHLLSLAVAGVTAYEYGYAADGGRRWKKDIANSIWTWFPCGVACSAGDLVEQTSDLTGQSWSTSALYLRGIGCGSSIHRRNSEWHLFDFNGVAGVITGGTANILSNNIYDRFGVEMYASGSAATQWRFLGRFVEEEGLVAAAGGGADVLVGRDLAIGTGRPIGKCTKPGYSLCNPANMFVAKLCKDFCAAMNSWVVGCCCTAAVTPYPGFPPEFHWYAACFPSAFGVSARSVAGGARS